MIKEASISNAPEFLNTNDKAMWVLGFNEALAQQEKSAQEASATWTEMVVVNLVREGVNKHRARELAAHFLTLPTQPALKDDIGVACLETMVKTMTNLGIATDASLEGFGARLESNIYAMCRAVDGLFKAHPALSDKEIWQFWWDRPEVPDGEDDSMEAEFVAACKRAIDANCRGCAK